MSTGSERHTQRHAHEDRVVEIHTPSLRHLTVQCRAPAPNVKNVKDIVKTLNPGQQRCPGRGGRQAPDRRR